MGCVSSKLLKTKSVKKKELQLKLSDKNGGDFPNHVVSLTSTTYGLLNLDQQQHQQQQHSLISSPNIKDALQLLVVQDEEKKKGQVFAPKPPPPRLEPEVINTWELMSDLEDESINNNNNNKSPRLLKKDVVRSPFKNLIVTQLGSPKLVKKTSGKENQCYTTPKGRVMKPWKFSTNSNDKLRKAASLESPRRSTSAFSSSRRRSLGPLFDPELIESLEKELQSQGEEDEQIKKMVSPNNNINNIKQQMNYFSRNGVSSSASALQLEKYEEKCPPGGENCVVIYTTTLRGIRKTFEDCNVVRSVVESYHIRVIERDVSMDSGFKEELRKLMGTKEVKVPLVFVKGRLIGGADEVTKLEEEGSLEGLLQGISKAVFGCGGCGGIRFVMCMDCSGSCKVLDQQHNNMIRCGHCNENGLIQCPICCSST